MSDLIDRQAAIDALKKHEIDLPMYAPRETDVFWDDAIDCCVSEIEDLPSVPVRMKGRWIPKEDRAKQEIFICSECGGWAYSPWIGSRKTPKPNWCKYKFCPNCSAEMRGEDGNGEDT